MRKLILTALGLLLFCSQGDVKKGYDNLELGDYENAIDCFTRAVEQLPSDYNARAGLGKACFQKISDGYGDSLLWRQCILNLSVAQMLRPDKNFSLVKSAVYNEWSNQLLDQKKDTLEALNLLSKAIAQDPTNPQLINQAAILYFNLKKMQQALDLFRLAISVDSTKVEPFFNSAMVFWAQESYDSSRKYLTKSYELNPDDSDIRLWLERCNDKDGAAK